MSWKGDREGGAETLRSYGKHVPYKPAAEKAAEEVEDAGKEEPAK